MDTGRGFRRQFATPSAVELLCLTACGQKINTVRCSRRAPRCCERCHLDIAAAARSQRADGAEALHAMEGFESDREPPQSPPRGARSTLSDGAALHDRRADNRWTKALL